MTDLTDKWEKGELVGEYWCEITESPYPERVYLPTCDNDIIVKVLAPVPSYEEWQASEKYNKHLEEVIKIYERKDKQATETSIAYNELAEENTKLKELLKECRTYISEWDTPMDLLAKIDEVLGEDK